MIKNWLNVVVVFVFPALLCIVPFAIYGLSVQTVVVFACGLMVGTIVQAAILILARSKPFTQIWDSKDNGLHFLGFQGQEPTGANERRRRVYPERRDKKPSSPEYAEAYRMLIVGEKLTPTQAWPKYADKNGLDVNDDNLKENFCKAMHRASQPGLWGVVRRVIFRGHI